MCDAQVFDLKGNSRRSSKIATLYFLNYLNFSTNDNVLTMVNQNLCVCFGFTSHFESNTAV